MEKMEAGLKGLSIREITDSQNVTL